MTETDQPNIETLIVWHGNRGLFSDYYLDHILPYFDAWKDSVRGCTAFLAWLQELYAQEQANLDHYSEEQLERHWFRPILAQLGHVYETQAPIPGLQDDQAKRPDYVFFLDETARQAALPHHGTAEYARQALAVAEVKKWQVSLSKKSRSNSALFTDLNPMWQLDYYLRATGLKWGFVSNGRVWRLMHGDSSYKLSQYYEVDLIALMLTKDIHKLQYFYLFFHQNAFKPDEQGVILLNMVLQGSRDYAIGVEKDLRENAYLALEQLMQGFLEVRQNRLGAADVMAIYQHSLYLLYRLLFILYAESQNLLPLYDAGYRKDYSLRELEFPLTWRDTFVNGRKYWDHVRRLFDIINGTDPDFNLELGLPRYNGGLFDPIQHDFLEKYRVGDRAFVTALRLLSQRTFNGIPQKVDYRALGVRQLGSIYEGLLEYQPRYATEKMVVVRTKNGEQWQPAAAVKSADKVTVERRGPGQIYLATDKGERKSTGSYYTPEYVVQYMVEQTLNPLLAELRNITDSQSFGERVLQLKILDPAMGSGHFLVAVADYLALVIVAEPSMAIETEIEAAQLAWKRRVVEWSLYGVDKNPLAVELAKLSLWLSTVARDKPLNFLDHHLRCGDALVGANLADLGDVPPVIIQPKTGQRHLFEQRLNEKLPLMLSEMWQLLRPDSDSYEAVHAKDMLYRALQQVKAPFEAIANLWVSGYFGHEFTPTGYDEAIDLITQPDKLLALPAMQTAQALAETHHFFHWELAFPEVFFDPQGQPLATPGFNMVISNPPYVRVRTLKEKAENTVNFLENSHRFSCAVHVWDIYMLICEQALKLSQPNGICSFIMPIQTLHQPNAFALRKLIMEQSRLREVVDLGKLKVFDEAMVKTCILSFMVTPTSDEAQMVNFRVPTNEEIGLSEINRFDYAALKQLANFSFKPDLLLSKIILDQIATSCNELGNLFYVTFGLRSLSKEKGKAAKGHLVSNQQSSDRFKPYMEGREISRYNTQWTKRYINYIREQMYSPRTADLFEQPKIVAQSMLATKRLVATLDLEHKYVEQSLVCIVPHKENVSPLSLPYILAVINSNLLSFYFARFIIGDSLGGGLIHATPGSLAKLPIRRIEFTTPQETRSALLVTAQARYQQADYDGLLTFAQARLAENQTDVVHDVLGYLAEQMIAYNNTKQKLTAKFWLDLEGMADEATFKAIRYKGKWEETLAQQPACQPFVQADSRTTRTLDESLAWNEEAFKVFLKILQPKLRRLSDFIEIYRDYAPTYRQAHQHLSQTDRLIDQLVYQLYGLTATEIALVEG